MQGITLHRLLKWYAARDLFDGNAQVGHRLYALFGAVLGQSVDLILGIKSEPTILSFGPMLAQIPAVLLPFAGYDEENEWWQAHVITFFPSLALGFMFGGLLSSQLLEIGAVEARREELVGFEGVGQSIFSISNLLGYMAAVRVFWAYIETGYMSRDKRYEEWVFLDPPRFTRQLIGMCQVKRWHISADSFIRAFLGRNVEVLVVKSRREVDREDGGILHILVLKTGASDLEGLIRQELEEWFNPAAKAEGVKNAKSYTRRPRRGGGGMRR